MSVIPITRVSAICADFSFSHKIIVSTRDAFSLPGRREIARMRTKFPSDANTSQRLSFKRRRFFFFLSPASLHRSSSSIFPIFTAASHTHTHARARSPPAQISVIPAIYILPRERCVGGPRQLSDIAEILCGSVRSSSVFIAPAHRFGLLDEEHRPLVTTLNYELSTEKPDRAVDGKREGAAIKFDGEKSWRSVAGINRSHDAPL